MRKLLAIFHLLFRFDKFRSFSKRNQVICTYINQLNHTTERLIHCIDCILHVFGMYLIRVGTTCLIKSNAPSCRRFYIVNGLMHANYVYTVSFRWALIVYTFTKICKRDGPSLNHFFVVQWIWKKGRTAFFVLYTFWSKYNITFTFLEEYCKVGHCHVLTNDLCSILSVTSVVFANAILTWREDLCF